MEKDQRDLLREFNDHNVRFLIIGGYAFSFYTEPRATKDLDIFIDKSPDNALRVFRALAKFGAPLHGVTPQDFENVDSAFQIGIAPSQIDILQAIEAVEFETAWQTSEPGMIGDIPVRYISFDDLVKNKLSIGRLRDLADVEALQQARAASGNKTESE